MEKSWYWRLVLVIGLMIAAIYQAAPSVIYFMSTPDERRDKSILKEKTPDWLPETRVNLGIDLQGGLHLVMGVDAVKAVQQRTDRVADELVGFMEDKEKPVVSAKRVGEAPYVTIKLQNESDYSVLKEFLDLRDETWEVRSHSGVDVVWGIKSEYEEQLMSDAVAQAQKTLRNRIDKYGVTEPEVRKSGKDSVLIQIAGLTAEEEGVIKEDIIGKTAQLEFKLVDDEATYFSGLIDRLPEGIEIQNDSYRGPGDTLVTSQYLTSSNKDILKEFVAQNPPDPERVVRYQRTTADGVKPERWRTWLLHRKTPLTGDSLVNAFVAFDQDQNHYYVAVKFDRNGAKIFAKLTGDNVKKRMAIVLDEIVDSAPVIQSAIPNGSASITLGSGGSQQEVLSDAKSLAVVLNAGALPAPVYPREQRSVGATLGDDAVEKGEIALAVAMSIMVLIMLIYYKASGIIAVVAMSVNMLFLFSALAAVNATLTLPGLAGLALTAGMAVDANIIQFERIREELESGKSARAAVDTGFDRAFSAIFDANVTTLLASIVLYQYGSGPIRGFATTLGIGVIINTFTAVVVPRLILDYFTRARRIQALSI